MKNEHIIATCWRCGLKALRRTLVFDGQYRNRLVHPECRDEVHPQERPPDTPVDAIALAGGSSVEPVGSIELSVVMNNGGAQLSWLNKLTQPTGTIVAFRVDRALLVNPSDTPVFAPVTTLSVTVTADFVRSEPNSYVDTGVVGGSTYAWRIVGLCSSGAEYVSNVVVALASPIATTPELSLNFSGSSGELWWSTSTVTSPYTIVGYDVYRSIDGGPYSLIASPTTTSYSLASLALYTRYNYYVVAKISNGMRSAISNIVEAYPRVNGLWNKNGVSNNISITSPLGIVITPNGRNLYCAKYNFSAGLIYQYSIGADGKLIELTPATVLCGTAALGGITDSQGRWVYYPADASAIPSKIYQYNVGSDGRLSQMNPTTVSSGGNNPAGLQIYKDKYLYCTNSGANGSTFPNPDNKLGFFDIGSDGKLSARSVITTISGPRSSALKEDGPFLYVMSNPGTPATIAQFRLDTDGTPIPLSPASFNVSRSTTGLSLTIERGGTVLTASLGDGTFDIYGINSNGTLSFIRNQASGAVILHPFEDYAYQISGANLLQFRRTGNGNITPLSPSFIAVGFTITGSVVITKDGKWGYITGRTSNLLGQFYLT